MKRSLFLLFACLFGALSGVKAYTVDNLTAAGWTLANNLDDITNNVYVFVDARSNNYVMSGTTKKAPDANTNYTPTYVTLSNPATTPSSVWTIESRTDGYALRNIESQKYFNGANYGWQDYMADTYDDCATFSITSSEGKYDIARISGNFWPGKYVGPWTDGGNIPATGENIAANKAEGNNAPGFFIYKMAKATYARNYLKQTPNLSSPVDVSYLIVNPTIYQGGVRSSLPTGWSNYGDHDVNEGVYTEDINNTHLYGMRIANKATVHNLDFDYYQTINSLPGGEYRVKADVFGPNSSHGSQFKAYLYIYATSKKSVQMDSQTWTLKTTEYGDLKDGSSLNIGMEADFDFDGGGIFGSTHTADAKGDNFRLEVDPYLSSMATEFNNGVEMTAGLWYHFTVANTGNHILTATNLNDIIYATGSETALSAAGSSKFEAIQTLSANTDYYIRSSSNNTLTITPCISTKAEELPDNGAMTAGDWYYFNVATAGHYDVVATSLANIVYTTNGDLPVDASVASKFSVKNNELSATRYYVKSSSAQTLQWFLTDDQDYSSRMSDELNDWTGVGAQTPKQKYGEGVETYNGNDKAFAAGGNVLYQTINNLPNGNYEVKFYAWENFANHQESGIPYGDNIAQVFANDATKDIYVTKSTTSAGFVEENSHTLNCHVTNGTLTYGVKNIATGGNWAVCRHISLTYTGPYNEVVESGETQTYEGTFTEDVDFTPTAECPIVDITGASFTGTLTANFTFENGFIIATAEQKAALGNVKNVVVENTCDNLVLTDGVKAVIPAALTQSTSATYSRTIASTSNYGTICLPYAVESNDDIQYYTVDQIVGNVLKLIKVASVDAGTPAIFKKKNGEATQITASNTNAAVTSDAGEQGESVTLKGAFVQTVVGDINSTSGTALTGKYYIKNNQFCQGVDYFTVNPFRAYIDSEINSGARLTLQVEDEATAISELKTLDEKQGLKDGKYLIGGKIIVVKAGKQFNVNGVLK